MILFNRDWGHFNRDQDAIKIIAIAAAATATAFGAAVLLGGKPAAVLDRLGSVSPQHFLSSTPSTWT